MASVADATHKIYDKFNKSGVISHSIVVNVKGSVVNIKSMVQKDYSVIDSESMSISSDESIAMSRAILKHFGVKE